MEWAVFKDRMFKRTIENPIEGETGYAVIEHVERELTYNEEYQIWHRKGIDPSTYREILLPRLAAMRV